MTKHLFSFLILKNVNISKLLFQNKTETNIKLVKLTKVDHYKCFDGVHIEF